MAGDAIVRMKVTPVFDEDLVDMVVRTGEALSAFGRTLQRLNGGVRDTEAICPFAVRRTVHDAHVIKAVSFRPGTVDTEEVSFDCPGFPA